MPHVIIEYSNDMAEVVAREQLTRRAHRVMIDSGLFATAAIKSRGHCVTDYVVGEEASARGFMHVLIYLMEGRSDDEVRRLTHAMHAALNDYIDSSASLTVDARALREAIYKKR